MKSLFGYNRPLMTLFVLAMVLVVVGVILALRWIAQAVAEQVETATAAMTAPRMLMPATVEQVRPLRQSARRRPPRR